MAAALMKTDINLGLMAPLTMFNETSKGGKGVLLREHFVFEGLARLIRSAASDEDITPFDADVLKRLPDILVKLGPRAFERPNLKKVVLSSTVLCIHALLHDYKMWQGDAVPVVASAPEASFHFLSAAHSLRILGKIDAAPFLKTLSIAPFWLARLVRATGNQSLLAALSPEASNPDTTLPYCLLHQLASQPTAPANSLWATLFSDPITTVLSIRFIGDRGVPWDYIPYHVLSPREAHNIAMLWPKDTLPIRLWETMAADPEWLVETWSRFPLRRPPQTACAALFTHCQSKVENIYAFAGIFIDWWRKSVMVQAAPAPDATGGGGGHDSGMLR